MGLARPMARRLLLPALLLAPSLWGAGGEAAEEAAGEALPEDDHCHAADEACAVNALQARAWKKAAWPGVCQAYGCGGFRRWLPCQCNSQCLSYGNCCADFQAMCSPHDAAPASASGCYKTGKVYKLSWKAQGTSFFNDWTFVTEDMVHGAQQLTTREEALAQGVIAAEAGSARLGVGGLRAPSRPDEAYKRFAAHIRSNQAWDPKKSLLVAMKYNTVPSGCGVWPGFWTVNSDVVWPNGGELDVLEYANNEDSKVSFHLGSRCVLDTQRINQCAPRGSGAPGSSDCYTSYFKNFFGCIPRQRLRRGSQYAEMPGVIAAEWTMDAITVYFFPDGQIPADLTADEPKPDNWSDFVMAYLPFARPCSAIGPQEVVLNVQLCGDAAGGPWAKSSCGRTTQAQMQMGMCQPGLSSPTDCCTQYVTRPDMEPILKAKAQFNVSWIKVFNLDGAPGQPSATYKRGGALLH
mmetsp:Transcript_93218/g.272873  ORF Transcript_93218/g.272873 Transcript_93218/m.272873 type:complete len:464 (-) Transcript_93218:69-1460(-)